MVVKCVYTMCKKYSKLITVQLLITIIGPNYKTHASSQRSSETGLLHPLSSTTTLTTSSGNGPIIFPDDETCHPPPDPTMTHYIVAYGSLMSTASKERTFKNTGASLPVQIKGFRREWNLKGDDLGPDTTYLGVAPDSRSTFNGVIFQLPQSPSILESLKSYDAREKFYCRRQVPAKDITLLANQNSSQPTMTIGSPGGSGSGSGIGGGQFWIYVNKPEFTDWPSGGYPIVQSYVDVFMSGCLEIEEKFGLRDFARMCVTSTRGWSGQFWINDRIFPRRPYIHQPMAGKIDAVLVERVPKEFECMRVEGFGLKVN